MKESAGFTLIELVIVIVILGILGAVAAPRFINMQGDAYEANVKALKGSIQSAMTLANTKAILNGSDKGTATLYPDNDFKTTAGDTGSTETVVFEHGFPAASQGGIIAMLQNTGSFGDNYNTESIGTTVLVIAPSARTLVEKVGDEDKDEKCQVEYTQATATDPAEVKAFTEGC